MGKINFNFVENGENFGDFFKMRKFWVNFFVIFLKCVNFWDKFFAIFKDA